MARDHQPDDSHSYLEDDETILSHLESLCQGSEKSPGKLSI